MYCDNNHKEWLDKKYISKHIQVFSFQLFSCIVQLLYGFKYMWVTITANIIGYKAYMEW